MSSHRQKNYPYRKRQKWQLQQCRRFPKTQKPREQKQQYRQFRRKQG